MDVKSVVTFLRVAELGSFTRAAEELNYVQSTVTTQIRQLEKELGSPLFDRTNRSVSLTAFGETYLPLAQRMYQTAQEMHNLNMDPREMTGTLRIGIAESLSYAGFLKLIALFRTRFPKVVLDFYTGASVEIVELIQKNQLDFGCCLATGGEGKLQKIFTSQAGLVFVCNRDHPLAQREIVSLEEISREHFVLTEENGIYHRSLLRLYAPRGLEPNINIRLKSTRGVVEILKYSSGVSFLPEYAVRSEVACGELGLIRTDAPRQEVAVSVVARRDKWISPPMENFLHLLQEEPWI